MVLLLRDNRNDAIMNVQDAVQILYGEEGNWRQVAARIEEQTGISVTGALVHAAGTGRVQGGRIEEALGRMGMIKPRKTVEIPACPDCGQVHARLKQCTTRPDPRRRRCWAGDPERARLVDEMVASYGYESLREMVDEMLVDWMNEQEE